MDYVSDVVMTTEGNTFWACAACGAVVGPNSEQREVHDVWHQQLDAAMGQTPA
jgi:hypothetical protein